MSGTCKPGTAPSCNDGVSCTRDSCNETTNSCSHTPQNSSCSDGLFCNGTETCSATAGCQAGTPPACTGMLCSDSLDTCVSCLTDLDCASGESCDLSTGACVDAGSAPPLPILDGDEWRYLKGRSEPPSGWATATFDDAAWTRGASGFGYGTDCVHRTVLSDMKDGYSSLYLRRAFDVADPAAIQALTLTMDYDDGFVAYLNGTEVARRNVTGNPPAASSLATQNHDCSGAPVSGNAPESFSLSKSALRAGTNVLAIQALNLSRGSSDFTVVPELEATMATACTSSADCNDGLYCNGAETCVSGTCQAPASGPCDDGIECTSDTCNEATDSCSRSGNDDVCNDGDATNGIEVCNVDSGCGLPRKAAFVSGDYDGDGRSDIGVFRAGRWLIRKTADSGMIDQTFGKSGDRPAPGDFDGDGTTDLAVFRSGTWHVKESASGATRQYSWGLRGDDPVPADYDGDGETDRAVFRAGRWIIHRSADGGTTDLQWGTTGDLPVAADYDGDGEADVAVYRRGTWIVKWSSDGIRRDVSFGTSTDDPAPHDYDGDGTADEAFFRDGTWHMNVPGGSSGHLQLTCGGPGDLSSPMLYDGDSKADAAVFTKTGTWIIHNSTTDSPSFSVLGDPGDTPISH